MNPLGLGLILGGVIGIVLGVLCMLDVGFVASPGFAYGTARGVGPLLAGLILLALGFLVPRETDGGPDLGRGGR